MRRAIAGLAGLAALSALTGCGSPPSAQRRPDDVARLAAEVLPVIDELDVSTYLDEGSMCRWLVHPRGDFREGGCATSAERFSAFDDTARADFDRVTAAMRASGVDTHRFEASISSAGAVGDARFWLEDSSIQWNWFYLYDPQDAITKNRHEGKPSYERISDGWWLMTEVDD